MYNIVDIGARFFVLLFELQLLFQFFDVIYEENAFALAGFTGLDNHDRVDSIFGLLLGHGAFEFAKLVRNNPSLGVEAKIDGVLILHFLKGLRQVGFSSHSRHRWKVIHLLKCLYLTEFFGQNCNVIPDDINICMPCDLFFLEYFSLRQFFLLLPFALLFIFLRLFVIVAIVCVFFLSSDNFPFMFKCALAQ